MSKSFTSPISINQFEFFEKRRKKRKLFCFDLELTARCNNNCRHCYINLPPDDLVAKQNELSLEIIKKLADEAASLGALWCLITGGEPLIRNDFFEIYLCLKKAGFLVSVLTNATLITNRHVELFKKYPPRDIEVTVYGVTQDTYEKVTRIPGSFKAFMKGINLLLKAGFNVTLKAMALRSNLHEFKEIASFCRKRSSQAFRFDPFLHLRLDGNPQRNEEIKSERLSPDEIMILERSDPKRLEALIKKCNGLAQTPSFSEEREKLFNCSAGVYSFVIGYDGLFRLCSSLYHPDCVYDLRQGSVNDARFQFTPLIKNMRITDRTFFKKCPTCSLKDLCMCCPAHAFLETGKMEDQIKYFCEIARLRKEIKKP